MANEESAYAIYGCRVFLWKKAAQGVAAWTILTVAKNAFMIIY